MSKDCTDSSLWSRPFSGQRAGIGLAAILVFVGVGCTNGTIQNTESGGGAGGTSGAGNGGGTKSGTGNTGGLTINTSVVQSTGGTGATSLICNSTSTSGCKIEIPEGCGDGINNQGGIEECDDGNVLPGDGCNGVCKVEKNWTCPKAGKCTRNIICGDGEIGAGEVCDDGNTIDGDGCNSTCTVQDPAFKCVAGQPCVRNSQCGNKRIEAGEDCDDGNTKSGDGCSATCKLEGGYVCPIPGAPCKPAPRCGDGVVQTSIGEICDDGNQKDGDGCSADCKAKGPGCLCTPGQLCTCPTVKCGNGALEGSEECDDGNTKPSDGCSGTCTIEKGYACPFTNAPCVPDCGDGIVLAPMEQCDPKAPGTNMDKACSSTCKYLDGWACVGTPPSCHQTKCGDGKVEGSEGCDDGNTLPNDGCSPTCHFEPNCSSTTGTCTSKCGDGLVVNEGCDDGNTNNGDGCSSTCTVEPGFQCGQPASAADTMTVPVTYRDFLVGGDFHQGDIQGSNGAVTGLVQGTLDSEGKPVFAGVGGAGATSGFITSAATFKQWYRDVPGTNTTYVSNLLLHNNGNGGFVNWWKDNQQWMSYSNVRWCADGTCTNCNAPPYVNDGTMQCFAQCTPWGTGNTNACVATASLVPGNPLFFPVDNVAGMITPTSAYVTAATPPMYSGNWLDQAGSHNFSFTSEVRYWFSYSTSKQYTLDFTGDDDVWVFVNRKLAVDLGGIHTPVDGQIVLNATGGGTVTVTPTEGPTCTTQGVVSTCKSVQSTVSLGMANNGVYEIVVFQAERAWKGSTYKLTLSGFNDLPSACGPICGDGVVSPGEQCDNGTAKNLGGYNQCGTDCRLGPYCGDAKVTDAEECDNGTNDDDYGSTSGCGPDCKLPARCGDGKIQTAYDEECDDGSNNVASTDPNNAYGGCMSNCKRGGRCGDGKVNGTEQCDDGVNDGTYATCNPDCTLAPNCGDGVVQADYGEECEPTMSNDPNCTDACRLPGGCGDGKIEPPEQCDDGSLLNVGDYGGCAPSCIFAPHCGDGIMNGPEQCDDGILDSSYGGCTSTCKLGPHCGDGIINGPEECDHGDQNGADGLCTSSCKLIIYAPP
jgi:fibro-slime domain-containing protein